MAELVDRDEGADTPHEHEGRAPPPPVPVKNKKKGKGKKKAAPTLTSEAQRREELQQLVARMRRSRVQDDTGDKRKPHKFWDTQPVPKLDEAIEDAQINDVIEPNKEHNAIRQEPYAMPEGFAWSDLDVTDESVLKEIYTLLNENYVEDDDAMFRFDYSMRFLTWALTPPGYRAEFHLGVRAARGKKGLMAFITGVPAWCVVRGKRVKCVEINYLCVHKRLRTKRLAPVLIKEITRRVNLAGIFQAVYTAGVVLPKPVASCRYFHRSLDPKKLIEIGFSRLAPRMTMARTIKLYKLPETPQIAGFRAMQPGDVKECTTLLTTYLEKFKLHPHLDESEVAHWILPREGVVDAFVVEDPATGAITDLCSFYHLPSTVIGHEKHNTLNAAYSFYNVATSVPLQELMRDALICARNVNMDVFNALNVMENDLFLKDLKFGIGDGHLQYYLYNWKCAEMRAEDVGLVLL